MTSRPIDQSAHLSVVAYHYVRDLARTRFPKLNALGTDSFRRQVQWLEDRYEMATLESALAFLDDRYRPSRDLCLLTFDDGLKEHYTEVLPILVERGIQGVFLVTTACMDGWLASVHKNHFLLASLDFTEYQHAVVRNLSERFPSIPTDVDADLAQLTHRFDPPDVAEFKYLLNYTLPASVRNEVLETLFVHFIGDEAAFARELYLDWDEAVEMQRANMVLGGHSHRHRALTTLPRDDREQDLQTCAALLRQRLDDQPLWPFSYPHGDTDDLTNTLLRQLGFDCGFTIRIGPKQVTHPDRFRIQRLDATDIPS